MQPNLNADIIRDISLLYELALSTGQSMVLGENAQQFLTILMTRKNLAFAAIFAYPEAETQTPGKLLFAQPTFRTQTTEIELDHAIWSSIAVAPFVVIHAQDPLFDGFIQIKDAQDGTLVCFRLEGVGILALWSFIPRPEFTTIEMNKLVPVIDQFARSLRANMAHGRLEDEIIERKQVEQALRQSQEIEEQFFANVSHEIRTPLNGILGMIHLLKNTALTSEQIHLVGDMKLASKNLLGIINDILDYTKIKQGRVDFERISFDVHAQLRVLYQAARARAHEKGIEMHLTTDLGLPQHIVSDPIRLTQILQNLVNNAIKFTHSGEVRVEIRYSPTAPNQGVMTCMVVDTGIGIPQDRLEAIFDNFVQASQSTTRNYGGTGLGLSIVKQLIELMDGHIEVESKVQEGTTFRVRLPIDIAPNSSRTERAPTPVPIPSRGSLDGFRILIAEDTAMNRKVAERLLEGWGATVKSVHDGQEAVALCQKEVFDLILMDIQMPQMDGYEATAYIRSQLPSPMNKVPIIALTASMRDTVKKKALDVGMNAYVLKPFEPDQLESVIRYYGQKRSMADSAPQTDLLEQAEQPVKLAYLHKLSDGDPQFIREMLRMLQDQLPLELENLSKYIASQNWDWIYLQAHKLKYPLASVGREDLQQLLIEVETLARERGDMDILKAKFALLSEGVKRVLAFIHLQMRAG